MTYSEHEGDLFTSEAAALGHGVNIYGHMSAGIAVQFRNRYPLMYRAYKDRCVAKQFKVGEIFAYYDDIISNRWIYNIASQDYPGPTAQLDWLTEALTTAILHAQQHHVASIAIPRIGCGIGGLDWASTQPALQHLAEAHPAVDLEVWSLPE